MDEFARSFVLEAETPVSSITEEMVQAFQSDGVIMLRGALSREWLMLTEMGLNRVLADSGVEKHHFFKGEAGEFQETIRNFDNAFEIRRLLFDSPIELENWIFILRCCRTNGKTGSIHWPVRLLS